MLVLCLDSTNSTRSFHFVVSGTCQNLRPSNGWAIRSQKNRQPFERPSHIRSQKIFICSITVHVIQPWMAYTFTNRFAYPFKRLIRCLVSLSALKRHKKINPAVRINSLNIRLSLSRLKRKIWKTFVIIIIIQPLTKTGKVISSKENFQSTQLYGQGYRVIISWIETDVVLIQ